MILKKIKNEVGATAIEYAILSALIGVATITGLQLTGVKLDNTYCYIATQISKAVGGSGGRCSATPSNSSSGPAGSGSGSSANGGNGSPTGSGSGSSTSDSNPVSDSNSQSEKIDITNAPFVGNGTELENLLEKTFGFKMSGIYDANGNPVTNGDQLANALGITPDEINVLKKGIAAQNENIAPLIMPRINDAEQIESDNKWLYFAPLSKVTFTSPKGDVYKLSNNPPSYGEYSWDGASNSFTIGDFEGPDADNFYYTPPIE